MNCLELFIHSTSNTIILETPKLLSAYPVVAMTKACALTNELHPVFLHKKFGISFLMNWCRILCAGSGAIPELAVFIELENDGLVVLQRLFEAHADSFPYWLLK